MSAANQALAALRVTEGNILSQWACDGREVFTPYTEWLRVVREAIAALEAL